jgi:hypothetical protein
LATISFLCIIDAELFHDEHHSSTATFPGLFPVNESKSGREL